MERRSLLAGLAGSALLLAGAPLVRALELPRPRIRRIERSGLGPTLFLGLAHAPFPAAGRPYSDDTVAVFVPPGWRPGPAADADLLVHFHGHHGRVRDVLAGMRLREQLVQSRRSALLVVPQGPLAARDSHAGKLEAPGGLARLLTEVCGALSSPDAADALGRAAPDRPVAPGRVLLSAHSGGYRAAACSVARGGLEVDEVFLFDALYGRRRDFRAWVLGPSGRGGPPRRLVSTSTPWGGTRDENRTLEHELRLQGLEPLREAAPGAFARDRRAGAAAIFVDDPGAHGDAVHRDDALFACLASSRLEPLAGAEAWS